MDLGTLASRFSEVRWLNDEKFRSHCPCPTHTDGDPDCSLLVRQSNGRIMVYCYGAAGDSQESILTALGLTPADLRVNSDNTPASTSEMPSPAPGMPSAALSTNGTTHDAITSNGHVERPMARDFGKWQLEVGYQFKLWFSRVSENERELLASHEVDTLVETLVTQAKDLIAAQKLPLFPLPELSESELDEELHRLAAKVVQAFRDDYLPAIAEEHLPTISGEIDRTPIDAYEAAQIMYADRRTYWLGGWGKRGCSIILSGPMGAGKTTFEMNFARARGLGVEFLDRQCEQGKTLVVVSPKEFDAWADTIGFWGLRDVIYLLRSTQTHFAQGAVEQAGWLEQTMKRGGFDVVVLDTLFDFFGMASNNTGDANRNALAEQTPLLEVINRNSWGLLAGGHTTKADVQAVVPREPEESFAGHTGWAAQHRMRMTIRRKSKGMFAFITGRGGYGDLGILEERLLLFDENQRLLTLGGKFSDYLGQTALPSILEALENAGGWATRSDLIKLTGKSKNWVHAAIKHGLKHGGPDNGPALKWNGKERRGSRYALPDEPPEQAELL